VAVIWHQCLKSGGRLRSIWRQPLCSSRTAMTTSP